ncbi:hypothetical protein D8674_041551 [Pyrus ussuriensis x Pyrus communis]|uniref:Uncharacterized protein n=1 Tax=Pyrus ussuriensis x Pyrus communis TaxID=2448454 RepID=A0A5N5I701_9ROSA|nr:hypothetical protein D8674_041551 [Pyrus ussuriensis x Pyrus communis]
MALKVAVKAALGAPHLLGDCTPFQPKGSSDLGGEESALQIALNQSQRQTQWFMEVNPEGKVSVVEDKLFVFGLALLLFPISHWCANSVENNA